MLGQLCTVLPLPFVTFPLCRDITYKPSPGGEGARGQRPASLHPCRAVMGTLVLLWCPGSTAGLKCGESFLSALGKKKPVFRSL